MRRPARFSVLPIICLVLPLSMPEPQAAEPALARLSFWVPPERMAEFGNAYQGQVLPILKRHKLSVSDQRSRTTVDSVFARLFAIDGPATLSDIREALNRDSTWAAVLRKLGAAYGTADRAGQIRYRFSLYAAPSGPGREIQVETRVTEMRGRGHWRSYSEADGIGSVFNVWCIVQDREGNIWFATRGGASCFDGQVWTNYTVRDGLASNRVTYILQDREGSLWFSTGSRNPEASPGAGVSRFDGTAWTTFTTRDGLASNRVSSILQDRAGLLWFGTDAGASRYDPSAGSGPAAWRTFTTQDGLGHDDVWRIYEDRAGKLWFGTLGGGVSCYDGKTFTTFTQKDGLANDTVQSILQDRRGRFWFGTTSAGRTEDGGVSRYDGQSWTTFTTANGLVGNDVQAAIEDHEGNLWFSTLDGVSRYDGEGFTTFTTDQGLVNNSGRSVFQDREGHLWFGTNMGVSRYDDQIFTTFTVEDGLPNNTIRGICQDREGNIWFGNREAVSRYDGRFLTSFTAPSDFSNIRELVQDRRGHIWTPTQSSDAGVYRYDGQSWHVFSIGDGLADNALNDMLEDRDGHLWFGTFQGVSRYDGQTWTTFTPEDGLAGNRVWKISQDRTGAMWFGTLRAVSRYDGGNWQTFRETGTLAYVSRHVYEDRDANLWFTTYQDGICRYDKAGRRSGEPFRAEHWTLFTMEDGLAGNRTSAVFEDHRGHLWLRSSSGGVTRYDGQVFQTLRGDDVLPGSYVRSLFGDRDGNFWMGTTAGLTRFRPPPPSPPGIVIDAVTADKRYEGISELSIPSTVGVTAFEFHGKSIKTRPGGMVYRYRLKGHDTGWTNTRNRRAEYEGLPAGKYTFEVLAVDRDLVYSKAPAAVVLTVHFPYERMGWLSALGIAMLLIAWQAVRLVQRNRELRASNVALSSANREIQAQTERKSAFLASMGHELRTPMNAIKGFTNLVLRRRSENLTDRQRENLGTVVQASDHLLAMINDLMDLSKIEAGRMDVNAAAFNVKALVASCCATVSPLLEEKPDVQLSYDVPDDVGEANTDLARVRQMLINLLSNAMKFTDSGGVTVRSCREDDQLVIAVADTGRGIPPNEIDIVFDEYRQVKGTDAEHKGTGLGLSIT